MQSETKNHLTLDQLNEDCLFQIFQNLSVCEQFTLLKLHQNFEYPILRVWKSNYSTGIDFTSVKVRDLALLPVAELQELLPMIADNTKALINVDELLYNEYFENKVFENIVKLTARFPKLANHMPPPELPTKDLPNIPRTFPNLETLHLQEPPVDLDALTTLSNLTELQLVHCTLTPDDLDWEVVMRKFRLKSFTLLSRTISAPAENLIFKCIKTCTALHTFSLNASDLYAAFPSISLLPHVPRLRVYTTICAEIGDVVPELSHCILRELSIHEDFKEYIDVVRLRCNFTACLLQHLHRMPNLRVLAWQSHFPVDLVNADGIMRWYAYDPQMTCRAVLKLIREKTTLKEIDLRSNYNISASFMTQVRRSLPKPEKGEAPTKVRSDFPPDVEVEEDLNELAYCDYKPSKPAMSDLEDYGFFVVDFKFPQE